FLNHQDLQPYHHFLKQIFNQQKYVLSDSEEKILNLVSQSARDSWISMTSTFLSKTQREIILENNDKKIVPFSEILSLTSSKHKKTRDSAAKQVHDIVAEYSDVATEELNAILQYKKITDELRGFDRPDQARHIGDGIDTEVVDALVDTVTKRFDIASNFYTLKAKLFNQPQLQYHERNVPYGDLDTNYPYSEAYNLVDTTLSQLVQEFGQIFRQFGQNGQFDVYPRPGKVSGAFCAHNLLTQPTYILLNHTEKL